MKRRHFLYRMGMAMAFVAAADLAPAGEWLRELKAAVPLPVASMSASELTGLIHEIFLGAIVPAVQMTSPTARMFGGDGDYQLPGEKLVFATDLRYDG